METFAKLMFFFLAPAVIAIAGGDRDRYGCIASAGYVWCDDPDVTQEGVLTQE